MGGQTKPEGGASMLRTILIYGVIAGVVVGGLMLGVTVPLMDHISGGVGMIVGYTTMLIALSAVFVGVKRYRDAEGGGVIGFWQALGIGVAISFIAGIFYIAAWELTVAVTHMDFANDYARSMIAQAKAGGKTGSDLAKAIAEANDFAVQYRNPLYRWPMTFIEIFPVGVLVSLITAALLRNSRFLPARRA
jgi:hypothetical protein